MLCTLSKQNYQTVPLLVLMHLTSRRPCWMIKIKAFLSSGKSTLFSYLCIELVSSLVALSRGCNPRILKPYLWLCRHVSWCFDSSYNNFIKYEIAAYTIKGVVRTVRKSCPSVNIFKNYVPYLNPEIQKWINSLLFIFLDNVSSSFVSGSSGLGFSSRYKKNQRLRKDPKCFDTRMVFAGKFSK